MNLPYDVITFDCYGTLFDWNRGLGEALAQAAAADGRPADRGALLAAYHDLEPVVEAELPRPYREVLMETARRVVRRLGWELSPGSAVLLPEGVPAWPPFPDTNPALERLHAAGYALGIRSNIDDDLLAATRRRRTVPFAVVVTAEQVGSYTPAPGHVARARQRIGTARWLHAAPSDVHDVVPARALGIPVAWINRRHESPPGDTRPDRECSRFTERADWLTGSLPAPATGRSSEPASPVPPSVGACEPVSPCARG